MNGNISSNGIKADLEAMQRAGIGGTLLMEIDVETPKGPVSFGSPAWRALFQHACAEARRLGLEIRMNNDAGYCGSGGPWITPELSMQKLVWTETAAKGPTQIDLALPQPQATEGFYRDIAVLAFPTPAGENTRMVDFSPRLRSSTGVADEVLARLVDGDTNSTVSLPQPDQEKPSFIEIDFRSPYTARQLVLQMPVGGDQIVHGWLQASDDGIAFRNIREFDVIPSTQVFNFAETSARWFRILFPTRNADVDQFVISEIELRPRCRIEGIEAKALFVRKLSYPGPSQFPGQAEYPKIPPASAVSSGQILDLTSHLNPTGTLRWQVPPGSWTILRLGHTSTGRKNHPAPEAGRGLECDKLSKAGAEAAFAGLLAGLVQEAKPFGTLRSTHIDSWEVGAQNWTADFPALFRRKRGYDIKKFLPCATGRIVNSLEESERFLWDFRQTISELLVENYAGHLRKLANRQGLTLSIEAYDGPCDDLTYAGAADEPMAEFWTIPAFEMAHTCTQMSSAAHVYGRPVIGAEAFTENESETWLGHPFAIKAIGDWAFCEGINRFVVHCYMHQPWTAPNRSPGMLFAQVGLHYQRTETWWEWSRPWHEYLTRCQYLLRQGTFVADVCHLAPEMAPRHWFNPDRSGARGGYNFDVCPAELVLDRMSVRNGALILPSGMKYQLLVLPDSQTMTPRLLQKIRSLVSAGATVIGPPPAKAPGLSDFPQCDEQVKRLAKEIWGDCDGKTVTQRKFGKGRIIWGLTPQEVLAADGVEQDFEARTTSGSSCLNYIHRTLPEAEIYFLANKSLETQEAVCAFRVINSRPAVWRAETGEVILPAVYDSDKATTRLPIRLGPAGSVFVVFPKNSKPQLERIRTVLKDNEPVLQTALPPARQTPSLPDVTNNFTFAAWVKPANSTTLPKEAVFGKGEYWNPRNDALYPPHGHYIYHSPDHSGSGLAVGTNGICVTECSADYWGTPLVYPVELTNWTHVTVVYRDGQPNLFLNGRFVHQGLRSTFRVHCGVGVPQMRGSPLFAGELGEFFHAHKVFDENEVDDLAHSMPPPPRPADYPLIELNSSQENLNILTTKGGTYMMETASGRRSRFEVAKPSAAFTLTGPWELSFPVGWGAPEKITLNHLVSWKDHPDPGIKHFSGTATYYTTFAVPKEFLSGNQNLILDLGKVAIMARVTLNGKSFGPLWMSPFHIDVTSLIKPKDNALKIEVVNLWMNRVAGDEQLPEDSDRNPNGTLKKWPEWLEQNSSSPSGRYTFSTYRLWKRDAPLQDSGLLGPVRLIATSRISMSANREQR